MSWIPVNGTTLIVWAVLLPEAMGMSGPGLSTKAMSRSVALSQLESVWMSMAHVATENHSDVCGLDCCLMPFRCLGALQTTGVKLI